MMFRIAALVLLAIAVPAGAQPPEIHKSEEHDFKIVPVAKDLEHPWSLAFLAGGDMLVTERPGRLNIIRKNGMRSRVEGLPAIAAEGQGGLLDVLLSPDFARDHTLYLSYSAGDALNGLGTEVLRARLNGARLEDAKVIFRAEPKTRFGANHFGSRLLFGPDGRLYITLGERFQKEQAQKTGNHLGKIIRLHPDGSIPADNPFLDREGFRPGIFTYGNRNVQGIALRPGTGQIWFHEHGPRGGDELNILKAGANYGWPAVTFGIDYSGLKISDRTEASGMEPPVLHWTPSIAPSGMAFYDGSRFPRWKNDLFVGALAHTHLRRLVLEGDQIVHQEILLQDLGERIRDVRTGPDGFLYILTDSAEGRVLRLEPAS